MVVFVKVFNSSQVNCLPLRPNEILLCSELRQWLKTKGLPDNELRFERNGRRLHDQDPIYDGNVVHALLGLPGGKGGFGSMLRAIGAQIEKTTNREACRDLSGRRLRDINEEQRLKRWVAKQVERERQAAKRRRAKLERLKTLPKHNFEDPNYDKQRAELPERIDDALNQGLSCQEVSVGQKRKLPEMLDKPKKPCLWLGIDEDVQESDESDDNASTISEKNATEESRTSLENDDTSSDTHENEPSPLHDDSSMAKNENSEDKAINNDVKNQIPEIQESLQLTAPSKPGTAEPVVENEKTPDLMSYNSIEELKQLGLDNLKSKLIALGLKCGGTLEQRAERLWAVRGMNPEDIDPLLLAKPKR